MNEEFIAKLLAELFGVVQLLLAWGEVAQLRRELCLVRRALQ